MNIHSYNSLKNKNKRIDNISNSSSINSKGPKLNFNKSNNHTYRVASSDKFNKKQKDINKTYSIKTINSENNKNIQSKKNDIKVYNKSINKDYYASNKIKLINNINDSNKKSNISLASSSKKNKLTSTIKKKQLSCYNEYSKDEKSNMFIFENNFASSICQSDIIHTNNKINQEVYNNKQNNNLIKTYLRIKPIKIDLSQSDINSNNNLLHDSRESGILSTSYSSEIIDNKFDYNKQLHSDDHSRQITDFNITNDETNFIIKDSNFNFNHIFNNEIDQNNIWNITTKPTIDDFIFKYKPGLIFAYGISNSGKTHTIVGNINNQGILPKSLIYVYSYIDEINKGYSNYKLSLKCSYVEIYNEEVYDLLSETGSTKCDIREKDKRFFLVNCTYFKLNSKIDYQYALNKGIEHKKHLKTKLNLNSSRSHTIFTLYLQKTYYNNIDNTTNSNNCSSHEEYLSCLAIVDLAGSERLSKAETIGKGKIETCKINTSLVTLGRCLEALKDTSNYILNNSSISNNIINKPFIPFRESKLTLLFQEYMLNEDSNIILISHVSLLKKYENENLRILNYCNLAKCIKPIKSKYLSSFGITNSNSNKKFALSSTKKLLKFKENNFSKNSSNKKYDTASKFLKFNKSYNNELDESVEISTNKPSLKNINNNVFCINSVNSFDIKRNYDNNNNKQKNIESNLIYYKNIPDKDYLKIQNENKELKNELEELKQLNFNLKYLYEDTLKNKESYENNIVKLFYKAIEIENLKIRNEINNEIKEYNNSFKKPMFIKNLDINKINKCDSLLNKLANKCNLDLSNNCKIINPLYNNNYNLSMVNNYFIEIDKNYNKISETNIKNNIIKEQKDNFNNSLKIKSLDCLMYKSKEKPEFLQNTFSYSITNKISNEVSSCNIENIESNLKIAENNNIYKNYITDVSDSSKESLISDLSNKSIHNNHNKKSKKLRNLKHKNYQKKLKNIVSYNLLTVDANQNINNQDNLETVSEEKNDDFNYKYSSIKKNTDEKLRDSKFSNKLSISKDNNNTLIIYDKNCNNNINNIDEKKLPNVYTSSSSKYIENIDFTKFTSNYKSKRYKKDSIEEYKTIIKELSTKEKDVKSINHNEEYLKHLKEITEINNNYGNTEKTKKKKKKKNKHENECNSENEIANNKDHIFDTNNTNEINAVTKKKKKKKNNKNINTEYE